MHATCGCPVKSTRITAIKAQNFTGRPIINERTVSDFQRELWNTIPCNTMMYRSRRRECVWVLGVFVCWRALVRVTSRSCSVPTTLSLPTVQTFLKIFWRRVQLNFWNKWNFLLYHCNRPKFCWTWIKVGRGFSHPTFSILFMDCIGEDLNAGDIDLTSYQV